MGRSDDGDSGETSFDIFNVQREFEVLRDEQRESATGWENLLWDMQARLMMFGEVTVGGRTLYLQQTPAGPVVQIRTTPPTESV